MTAERELTDAECDALRRLPVSFNDMLRAAYRAGELAMRERAVAECMNAWPPAHTYASENADMYRAQDRVREKIANAIAALARNGHRCAYQYCTSGQPCADGP